MTKCTKCILPFTTTDGTIPDKSTGILYTGEFTLIEALEINAVTFKLNRDPSDITTKNYSQLQVKTPETTIYPKYYIGRAIPLKCETENAVVHYTVDGSTPTKNSPIWHDNDGSWDGLIPTYSSPTHILKVSPEEHFTLKLLGRKTGYKDSEIAESYIYVCLPVPELTMDPPGLWSSRPSPTTITLNSSVVGGKLSYRLSDYGQYQDYTAPFTLEVPENYGIPWVDFRVYYQVEKEGTLTSEKTDKHISVYTRHPKPVFSIEPDSYPESKMLTISVEDMRLDSSDVIEIYYKIEESNTFTIPSKTEIIVNESIYWTGEGFTRYTTPIQISKNCKITALANTSRGYFPSNMVVGTYIIADPPTPLPEFSQEAGAYKEKVMIDISHGTAWNITSVIYYTLDGTDPVISESTSHSNPNTSGVSILIEENTTIKALAVAEGYSPSSIVEKTYHINKDWPALSSTGGTITQYNQPVTGNFYTVDSENDPLTYELVSQPDKGILVWNPPEWTYTPATNQTEATSFTYRYSDSWHESGLCTWNITINTVPTISEIPEQTIDSGEPLTINFIIADNERTADLLSVTVTSNNQGLIPNTNLVIGGSDANRNVKITSLNAVTGVAIITVRVSDYSGGLTNRTFKVTVNSPDTPPQISVIPNQSTNEDTATNPISFTISDDKTLSSALTVSATSDNQTLIPDGNLALGGSEGNRTITATPVANQNGTAVITITVNDGTLTTQETFTLSVIHVNEAPILSNISDMVTLEDIPAEPIDLTISDLETSTDLLTVTAVSDNTNLLPSGSIVLSGTNDIRTLSLTPNTNMTGSAVITVTVSDGSLSSQQTFTLTVIPVNDAPVLTDIPGQATSEDTTSNPITLNFNDVDNAYSELSFSGSSSDQSIVADNGIVFSGTDFNRSVTITPVANASGSLTITLTLSDGTESVQKSFAFTVGAVPDAPQISPIADLTWHMDQDSPVIYFNISDPDSDVNSLTVSASETATAINLFEAGFYTLGGSGANRTIVLSPTGTEFGVATITLTVSDGVNSSQTTFQATVNGQPGLDDITDQSMSPDSTLTPLNFNVYDWEGPATLTVTATSANQTLITDGNIVTGGSDRTRTLSLTPEAGQTGTSIITVTVTDGNLSAQDTFTLTVNNGPTISGLSNMNVPMNYMGWTPFTLADIDTDVNTLTVTVTHDNNTLFPVFYYVDIVGDEADRNLYLQPDMGKTGTANLVITVSDGVSSTVQNITVTVGP